MAHTFSLYLFSGAGLFRLGFGLYSQGVQVRLDSCLAYHSPNGAPGHPALTDFHFLLSSFLTYRKLPLLPGKKAYQGFLISEVGNSEVGPASPALHSQSWLCLAPELPLPGLLPAPDRVQASAGWTFVPAEVGRRLGREELAIAGSCGPVGAKGCERGAAD